MVAIIDTNAASPTTRKTSTIRGSSETCPDLVDLIARDRSAPTSMVSAMANRAMVMNVRPAAM